MDTGQPPRYPISTRLSDTLLYRWFEGSSISGGGEKQFN
jgi:hypothetical protein